MTESIRDLELRFLDTPFENLRVRDSKHEADLSASLERVGQQVPVTVVVGSDPENWILVDGHRRVRALKRLGKDTIQAVVLEMSAPEALFRVRVDLTRRPLDVFEEALLIREVHQGHGIGIEAIADRFGKSQTWVRQRMDLVTVLPDDVQQRVLKALLDGYLGLTQRMQDLLDDLLRSIADRTTKNLMNRLSRLDVLLADEMGYLCLNKDQSNLFSS